MIICGCSPGSCNSRSELKQFCILEFINILLKYCLTWLWWKGELHFSSVGPVKLIHGHWLWQKSILQECSFALSKMISHILWQNTLLKKCSSRKEHFVRRAFWQRILESIFDIKYEGHFSDYGHKSKSFKIELCQKR